MARTRQGASKRRCGIPLAVRLLPLPESAVRQRMIAYHLTLSSLRLQRGDLAHFVTMAQIIVSTSHLFDAGYGRARIEGLTEAHDALERSLRAALASGIWGIDPATFELFAELLTLHEEQLHVAPLEAVIRSSQPAHLSRADGIRSVRRAAA
ncbi:hypothetical protein LMG27952_04936 [Paraburkholderia hiiakae]|uniref:Fis family transcriptional regulator n=1 Tax=Paraburkholderia hiiakae TaxID=1081782 RepID=A0ABM8NYU7_9BURK|nr:hypothetical protein [Paraburkholderia hiiakae]CAD6549896.1 hypothetical protein LMG27952_04936 [Paraburkholderia hiiakae]